MNYEKATPIQESAIPVALENRDIIGIAQTGTGKTAAFAIPMVEFCLKNPNKTALVLAPTRELAAQIREVVFQLTQFTRGIRSTLIVGGASMRFQFDQLRRNPSIIIATPGRLIDHLERQSVRLENTGLLVLDEADRMLDMGFGPQIDEILKKLPKERQSLLFSATLPPKIKKLAENLLQNPEHIEVTPPNTTSTQVEQSMLKVEGKEKSGKLLEELKSRNKAKILIFTRTKRGADRLHKFLKNNEMRSDCIHGDRSQSQRNRSIQDFRTGRSKILVATDVASRGLDVDKIEMVINYDLPQTREDYIHRIGRTGRAGLTGEALSFVTPEEHSHWKLLQGEKAEKEKRGFRKKFGAFRKPRQFGFRARRNFRKAAQSN